MTIPSLINKTTVQAVLASSLLIAFVIGFLVTKQISGEAMVGAVMLALNHFFRQNTTEK